MSDEITKESEGKECKTLLNDQEIETLSPSNDTNNSSDKLRENTLNSYIHEWKLYFSNHSDEEQLLNSLRSKAFKESLRGCFFRSICWRVFLGCLPGDQTKWSSALDASRTLYNTIKSKHFTDPHLDDKKGHSEEDDPLSQRKESRWSQFFKNEELKDLIDRDVKRTCPELKFFRKNDNRNLLANVLFSYAREHETLSYRQGMHELLAPLVFVLHCDLQGAAHARENGDLPDEISEVLNEDYLEHDAYTMFCQVMNATNPWYAIASSIPALKVVDDSDKTSDVPFQSSENLSSSPPLAITKKLKHIHCTLLARFDPELFQHLNRLEIIPQVYGLRWVRLLFGREFDLQDLLVLWDALFADSQSLNMVDYIFVSMMFNIRQQLLRGDYCKCMQLLMKYPDIEDIFDLVHLAMHYRDPKNNQMPKNMRRKSSFDSSSVLQSSSANTKKKKILPNIRLENPFSNLSLSIKKNFLSSPPQSRRSAGNPPLVSGDLAVQYNSQLNDQSELDVEKKKSMSSIQRLRSLSGLDSVKVKKTDEEILQNEVHVLKQQLETMQEKCHYCSDKIDASIRILQPIFMKNSSEVGLEITPNTSTDPDNGDSNLHPIKNEDQLVALANLKQVRDMLRGILSFMEKKPRTLSSSQISDVPSTPSNTTEDWMVVDKPSSEKIAP